MSNDDLRRRHPIKLRAINEPNVHREELPKTRLSIIEINRMLGLDDEIEREVQRRVQRLQDFDLLHHWRTQWWRYLIYRAILSVRLITTLLFAIAIWETRPPDWTQVIGWIGMYFLCDALDFLASRWKRKSLKDTYGR